MTITSAHAIELPRTNLLPGFGNTAIKKFSQNQLMLDAKITALEQLNGWTILDKWVLNETRLKRTPGSKREMRNCYRLDSCLRKVHRGCRHKTSMRPRQSPFSHFGPLSAQGNVPICATRLTAMAVAAHEKYAGMSGHWQVKSIKDD